MFAFFTQPLGAIVFNEFDGLKTRHGSRMRSFRQSGRLFHRRAGHLARIYRFDPQAQLVHC